MQFSTLGKVAIQIAEDYQNTSMNSGTRYTAQQAIEKVCIRRESITSMLDNVPSYLWWYLRTNEYGEIVPVVDLGKLPHQVRPFNKNSRKYRYVFPREVSDDSGPWEACLGFDPHNAARWYGDDYPDSILALMLQEGLNFGQPVLSRCVGAWNRSSYEYDEWDMSWDVDIVYKEPWAGIDIPLSYPSVVPINELKSIRVC